MSSPWTLFDMALLTLLTLLAAAAARGDARSCNSDQRPTLAATRSREKYIKHVTVLIASYGEDVKLFCSSNNASNLAIRNDEDQQLLANRLNTTTIQVSLIKPDVGEYRYYCTDSNTSCTETLSVFVLPAMSVRAPRALKSDNRYLVPPGEPYGIFCSSAHSVDLSIKSGGEKLLNTIVINETSVTAKVNDKAGWEYTCYWRESYIFSDTIYVDRGYFPEATKFRCFLYPEANVECSWESLNVDNHFELSLLYDEGSILFCRQRSVSLTRHCEGPLYYVSDDRIINNRISVQVETCFKYRFCSSQFFHKKLFSILKLPPISDVKLINSSPQGATVAWSNKFLNLEYTYKVEYRLLGTDWRPVNASAVRCKKHTYVYTCELYVPLPCSDAHYELRVSTRNEEAADDAYWSNPTSLFFYTTRGMDGKVDPSCDADFREVTQEPPPSASVLLYDVRQLVSDQRKEQRALRRHVSDMYKKINEIRDLMQKKRTPK